MATDKLPWMQWYGGDWLADPCVTLCSPATRGIWMDLLCHMHRDGRRGQVTGTLAQLARMGRCTTDEVKAAIAELESTKTADVDCSRNAVVTVRNRRMARAEKDRKSNARRQQRFRDNRGETLSNGTESESESEIKSSPPPKTLAEKLEVEGEEIFDVEGVWANLESLARRLGLNDLDCFAAPRNAGCDPSLVGMVLGYFESRPRAWSVGYLHYRIRILKPDDDPTKGWPEPSYEWKQDQEAKRPPRALSSLDQETQALFYGGRRRKAGASDEVILRELLAKGLPQVLPAGSST